MAIKYSSVPDSLFTITEGNGIEFKDLDYSAWQSTVESQAGQWAVLMSMETETESYLYLFKSIQTSWFA